MNNIYLPSCRSCVTLGESLSLLPSPLLLLFPFLLVLSSVSLSVMLFDTIHVQVQKSVVNLNKEHQHSEFLKDIKSTSTVIIKAG